jgi:hypothetical protein
MKLAANTLLQQHNGVRLMIIAQHRRRRHRGVTQRLMIRLCAVVLLVFAARPSAAAEQLKIVVGFAAGGSLDVLTRVVAARVQSATGMTIIVENRAAAAAGWRLRRSPRPSPTAAPSCRRRS